MKETTYSLIICGCNIDLSKKDYDKLMMMASQKAEHQSKSTYTPCEDTTNEITAFKIKKKHWEYDFSLSKWEEEEEE